MKNVFLALVLVLVPSFAWAGDMVSKLQDISITVQTAGGSGSGVLKTRKVDGADVSFIWTANHVIDSLRKIKKIVDSKSGTERTIVEYDDASVVQTINEDGRMVARYSLLAQVVKTSPEEDLALLRVRKKNFSTASVKFYLDKELPPLGNDVWNVGSALGIDGSNTVSKGVVSQHGRILENKTYDQVSCPGFPGCSGSGVYLNDGRMIGMLTRGSGETFILIVPTRRIVDWAKSTNLEWSVDDAATAPTEVDLKKIVVEDNGINFDSYRTGVAPKKSNRFKTFFKVNPLYEVYP